MALLASLYTIERTCPLSSEWLPPDNMFAFSYFIIKDEIKSRLFNLICQDFLECGMHFEVPSVDANKYRYKVPKERSQNMH